MCLYPVPRFAEIDYLFIYLIKSEMDSIFEHQLGLYLMRRNGGVIPETTYVDVFSDRLNLSARYKKKNTGIQ